MNSLKIKPNIEIVKPIRRSIVVFAIRMLVVLFLVDTVYAGLLLIMVTGYIPVEWSIGYTSFLWIIHTVKYIVISILLVKMLIGWFSTLYYISDGHLIRQRGVLSSQESVFRLTDIQSVLMSQSWMGKMLNYGTLELHFQMGQQKEVVLLYAITSPQRYEKIFTEYV